MYCEIRKSCKLKNIVYELSHLGSPAVILIDASGVESTDFVKGPRDIFWDELIRVFRDATQAHDYTLEEDIRANMIGFVITKPVVIQVDEERALTSGHVMGIVRRLRGLNVSRVALIYIINSSANIDATKRLNQLAAGLTLTEQNAHTRGIDSFIILDYDTDDDDENY